MKKELLPDMIRRYEDAMFVVNRRINAAVRGLISEELTLDQYAVIRYLGKRDRCTSSELADTFCVGKSSITALTTRLFDKRLIERHPDEHDRRVTYLDLTPEGRRVGDEMKERIQDLLSGYLGHFQEKEAVAFIETFEKLAKVLVEHDGPSDAD
ncbi:MarR family transcriptional regulator [Paenibacillus sp. TRM 82003]|nr:MarR family transcriptional regulator [Paenibacillus sp. TRM 82003]